MNRGDWEERKYGEVFEETCRKLRFARRAGASFTVEHLRGMLRTAYVNEGNDWVGRGALASLVLAAEIAAHEHVLAEWEAEARRE